MLSDTRRSCDVEVEAWHHWPMPLDAIIARQDAVAEWPEERARAAE